MSTMQKGVVLWKCLNTCPLFRLQGNSYWLVYCGCDRFRTAPFFICQILFKKRVGVYYQVQILEANGFKISDIDQLILALIFIFGVTLVLKNWT